MVSAIAHAGLVYLALFVLPALMASQTPPPVAYTVKIVDSIPAGDLGTRLPAINRERARPRPVERRQEARKEPEPKPAPTPPAINERNAIALNTLHHSPTPTPTPTPAPTHAATPAPTVTPHPHHTARPTPHPRPTPKAKPTPKPRAKPRPTPIAMAKAEPTPNVRRELEKVREQLLREHLAELKKKAAIEAAQKAHPSANPGSGPVVADREHPGAGMGVGSGNGSAGIQQDPDFLLYYQQVQERIRDAWSFTGGNPDSTATVEFGINPDGNLNSIKVTQSSRDPAFDDSVVRAIRGAGPFPPPPGKYRQQFAEGVEAVFKLSELKAGD